MKTTASIGWNRFIDINWLILVDLLISIYLTQWFDLFNHNQKEREHCGKTWLIRAQALQILWDSIHILMHALIEMKNIEWINTFKKNIEKHPFFNTENIVAPLSHSRFPVKLICFIAFESASSACCFINLLLSSYIFKNNYSLANNQLYNHLLDHCDFEIVIICCRITFNWLIKKIFFHKL